MPDMTAPTIETSETSVKNQIQHPHSKKSQRLYHPFVYFIQYSLEVWLARLARETMIEKPDLILQKFSTEEMSKHVCQVKKNYGLVILNLRTYALLFGNCSTMISVSLHFQP